MKRFIDVFNEICERLFTAFIHNRLTAELPGADELIQDQEVQRSDDPRVGGQLPMVGAL